MSSFWGFDTPHAGEKFDLFKEATHISSQGEMQTKVMGEDEFTGILENSTEKLHSLVLFLMGFSQEEIV